MQETRNRTAYGEQQQVVQWEGGERRLLLPECFRRPPLTDPKHLEISGGRIRLVKVFLQTKIP